MTVLSVVFLVMFFAGCTKDGYEPENGMVDVAGKIRFEIKENTFKKDELTRSTTQTKQVMRLGLVDLGDDLAALVTLERTPLSVLEQAPLTRALSDGTYTILAYGESVPGIQKGMLTGTVSGNIFTPGGTHPKLVLPHGKYRFYCLNSSIELSGDECSLERAAIDLARIGEPISANPVEINQDPDQYIPFQMDHQGARMKMQLEATENISEVTATLTDAGTGAQPLLKSFFNLSTLQPIDSKSEYGAMSEPCSFPASVLSGTLQVSKENTYHYFQSFELFSNLKVTFNSGTVYGKSMAGKAYTLGPVGVSMDVNHSYVLRLTLKKKTLDMVFDAIGSLELDWEDEAEMYVGTLNY